MFQVPRHTYLYITPGHLTLTTTPGRWCTLFVRPLRDAPASRWWPHRSQWVWKIQWAVRHDSLMLAFVNSEIFSLLSQKTKTNTKWLHLKCGKPDNCSLVFIENDEKDELIFKIILSPLMNWLTVLQLYCSLATWNGLNKNRWWSSLLLGRCVLCTRAGVA